jgi:PTH1 family peptidyl-tRNA hydrolase
MIKLLLGLGNPGKKYIYTRHNLGYALLDLLAKDKKFVPGKGQYFFVKTKIKGQKIILAKPTTFMNRSGIATRQCLDDFGLGLENLLVLCDDVNLPLGKIRIRPQGTDGGHNGLKSVIYELGYSDFARLRMGVSFPLPDVKMEDYVLRKFKPEEKKEVEKMLQDAGLAIEDIISSDIKQGMNRFN